MFLHITYLNNYYSSANNKPFNCKCTSVSKEEINVYHLKVKLSCFCTVATIFQVLMTNHSIANVMVLVQKKVMLATSVLVIQNQIMLTI